MGNSISGLESNDFPGSTVMDLFNPCGDLVDVVPSPTSHEADDCQFLTSAEGVCAMSPTNSEYLEMQAQFEENEYEEFGRRVDKIDVRDGVDDSYSVVTSIVSPGPVDPTSALFAKALVNEVTNNPETMLPKAMVERERKLLKAQNRARSANKNGESKKAVGAPGGVGQPTVIGSIAHALTGTTDPVSSLKEAFSESQADTETPHTVTIGLCLTQRSLVGHPDTITRQTAFDFNELQDREYNFVSNTDSSGWRAGGGEPSGSDKVAAVDKMHIPIITIKAGSPHTIDAIIEALARGELFIPHMSIMPQSLSVDGVSPPDLSVRFGTERNEDIPPEQWPNWCLEFMHNQLYEYFEDMGACWSERPYSITLAKQVRWKTVKHMNQYLSKAGNVIDTWREKGPQYLNPQLTYLDGSSVPEEVARPHGIYLFRDGVPTNYFAPNFSPPYSTNMTRNLLLNVLNKSWDKQRREWTSEPVPPLVTPSMLVSAVCGCTDSMEIGYMANEVTLADGNGMSTIPNNASIRSVQTSAEEEVLVSQKIETLASVMTPKERSQASSKVETSISPLEKRLSSPNVETVTSQEGDEQSVKEMGVPQPPSLEYDYEDLLLQEETSISTAHEGKDDDKEKASSHMKKASGHNAEELAKEALKSAEIDDSLSATKNASSTNFGTSGKALASDEDWFDDFVSILIFFLLLSLTFPFTHDAYIFDLLPYRENRLELIPPRLQKVANLILLRTIKLS